MDGDVGAARRAESEETPTSAVHGEILRPIEGPDRAGEDPRLLEAFEAIEVEIAKIGAVELLEVDWKKVEALSAQLLILRSKDLRCACWWAIARLYNDELAGLRQGLATLAALLCEYGDAIHPRRPKARVGASLWFAHQLDDVLRKKKQLQITKVDLADLGEAIDTAARVFGELELDPAEFYSARESLQLMKIVASEAEREEEVRKAFPTGYEDLGLAMLRKCGEHNGAETALTLRMRRWALWMAPPSVVGDNRRDVTTARDQADELASLHAARKWAELLARCEKLFTTSPFWLDLTYWSARAAGQLLGDEAKHAIVGELRALLSRDPSLVSAADRDGAPLLCDEARDWVERDVTQSEGSRNGDESASVHLPPEIRQLLDSGQVREAMVVASSWITVCSGRVRFARSVALANAFMRLGAAEQSFLVFRGLHSQLRQMTVKEWEPRLFAACLEGYLSSKKMGSGLGMEDEPLLEELSVLDPTAVLGVLPT
jgi:predicted component of type VI protein secretion system